FLKKAIRRHGVPEKITIDGSDANEAAIKSYNEEHGTTIIIRQVKYLNNIVEQDHRGVKRVTRPMLGFKSFTAAQDTLVGIELMHMIKTRQLVVEEGDEGHTAAALFSSLAASSLPPTGVSAPSRPPEQNLRHNLPLRPRVHTVTLSSPFAVQKVQKRHCPGTERGIDGPVSPGRAVAMLLPRELQLGGGGLPASATGTPGQGDPWAKRRGDDHRA